MAPLGEEVNLSTLLGLPRHEISTRSGSAVVSYTHDLGSGPVLWLVHGYPQSAYIWRHLVPQLKDKISLFIPELPGYGLSSRPKTTGFGAIGAALLEASHKTFAGRPIILGGHDRGARICHRLSVAHAHPPRDDTAHLHAYSLLGTILLDIVPTSVQWRAFANPAASAAYFHWPLLASPAGPDIVEAFGGDRWTHLALDRICGDNSQGRKDMQSDGAWDVYESLHAKRETIEGSCADYAAGCYQEPQDQAKDQQEGRKIRGPVLVIWSAAKLGRMHDHVGQIWMDWVEDPASLTAIAAGDDVGHYLPEEANKLVGKAMLKFLDGVLK